MFLLNLIFFLPAGFRERLCLHHILPTLPCHASGKAAQSFRGHPQPAMDIHQVLPGRSDISTCFACFFCLFAFRTTPTGGLNFAVLRLQALPHVALLIVMLFFIYAVIGMQVRPGVIHLHVGTIDFYDACTTLTKPQLFIRSLVRLPWWTAPRSTATTTFRHSLRLS